MPLDLPPKEAPNADGKAAEEAKPKRATTSNAAVLSRLSRLEKLVGVIADNQFGKNVRPALPEDENEEGGA